MATDRPDITPSDPVKWRRIATELRTRIENGDLKPGASAPSITELVDEGHANARQTCAKALRVLAEEGLLIRYPGLGYYVADRAGRSARLSDLYRGRTR
jgi:DNA-binding GntR family transcriptional regulator